MMNSPAVQVKLQLRAEAIQTYARSRIHKRSGETARSVAVEIAVREDGVLVRRVGYDLDVTDSGPYYEFGTEDTPPHPTLRQAGRSAR
jgi:HK97 gp10 family phage protein